MPQFPAVMAAGAIAKGLSGQFQQQEKERTARLGQPSTPTTVAGQAQGQPPHLTGIATALWDKFKGPQSQVNLTDAMGQNASPNLIPSNMMGQPNPLIPQGTGGSPFLDYVKKIFGG